MKRKFCAGILIAIFLVSIWMLDRNCSVLIDSYDNAAVESVGMTDVMTGNVTDGDKPKIALTFDDGKECRRESGGSKESSQRRALNRESFL